MQPSDDAGELTKNLQALNDEEKNLEKQAEQTEKDKAKIIADAKKKAQAILEKARDDAEKQREKILAAKQEDVDKQVDAILRKAEKDAAALKKKKLDVSSKLLPLLLP